MESLKTAYSRKNLTEIGQSAAELWPKHFFKWRPSAMLNFKDSIMGSLKSPCRTSYRLSIEIIALNGLVFEKICLRILVTDIQTDRRTNRWTEPMRKGALAIASGALKSLHQSRFIRLENIVFTRLLTNRWTDGQTDGRTD